MKKRVIIQGWGNVASAAGLYLSHAGAKIIGIIDRGGGIIDEEGMDLPQIKKIFLNKIGNKLNAPNILPFEEVNKKIWDLKADVFIPGAASKLVTRDQIDRLMAGGLELMSCGANVPFTDDAVFFGETAKHVDAKISIIPDFIANCGMARVFAYLMHHDSETSDDAIMKDVSKTIWNALNEVKKANPETTSYLSTTALSTAIQKLIGDED